MDQPWNELREGGGGFAMGESRSCGHAELDDQQAVCDVEGALLMELMEDLPSSDFLLLDADVDRQLSHVIRSLEAEIGGSGESGEAAVMMMADEGGGESLDRIQDVLFSDDMDGCDYEEGAASSSFRIEDEAEGWCVYTNNNGYGYVDAGGGVLGYDTVVDHQHYYYCCAEGSADHMYLPLWE